MTKKDRFMHDWIVTDNQGLCMQCTKCRKSIVHPILSMDESTWDLDSDCIPFCDENCQLFRWGKCETKREDGICDIPKCYDSDDLDFRRIK